MKLPALVRACHPGPVIVVTAVATGLAVASGRNAWQTASVLVTVLLGQLSVGWSNDALDARRDAETGRTDKPIATGEVSRRLALSLAIGAAVVSGCTGFIVGWQGVLHIVGVAGGWLYNHPLKRTAYSVVPYTVSFALLVTYAAAEPRQWMVVTGALLGTAAHFANVLPDLDDDAKTGVRGLPHRLGATGSEYVVVMLLLVCGVLTGLRIGGFAGPAVMVVSVLLAIGVLFLRPGRTVFRVVMAAALVDVVALLAAVAT